MSAAHLSGLNGCSLQTLCECINSTMCELLAIAASMKHTDSGHNTLIHYAALKGLILQSYGMNISYLFRAHFVVTRWRLPTAPHAAVTMDSRLLSSKMSPQYKEPPAEITKMVYMNIKFSI